VEFGLGKATGVDLVEIRWPAGLVESFRDLKCDWKMQIREGDTVKR